MSEPTLLERLKASANIRRRVPWPGCDAEVMLRLPTEQDQIEASLAADRLYRDAKLDIGMHNVQDREAEQTTQLLWLCTLDPATGKQLCASIADFRRLLVGDVRAALVEALAAMQQECSPRLDNLNAEQFDALLCTVKKTPERALSNVSSICLLRKLCAYLAAQPSSSQTANGST